ncbi:MAG: XdhC family protein [Gammaproteobacteria bacterium]|nr:XdhC family protein [Gammaproteobacteria bacterium]
MKNEFYEKIAEIVKQNSPHWVVTVVHAEGSTPTRAGLKMLVNQVGEIDGTVGGGAVERAIIHKIVTNQPAEPALWSFDLDGNSNFEATGMVCGGIQQVFIEPLFNTNCLYIIGAGHCGRALSELASKCDFNITMIDDRAEFADANKLPFADSVICDDYANVAAHINFSQDAFIVVMTHGHKHDGSVLEKLIDHQYKYLGVIGSKKKAQNMLDILAKKGFSKDKLAKVCTPIGLPIGSQTPTEIAVSITAQLISIKNNLRI